MAKNNDCMPDIIRNDENNALVTATEPKNIR
jgi:hypothetical protein